MLVTSTVLHKFLEPSRCFTLTIGSNVSRGTVQGPAPCPYERWSLQYLLKHTSSAIYFCPLLLLFVTACNIHNYASIGSLFIRNAN